MALDTPDNQWHEESLTAPDGSSFAVRVLCADRPPAAVGQLSLPLEAAAPERIAPPKISGIYDSTAAVTSVALFADCPRRYYLARYLGWDGERRRPVFEQAEEDDEAERDPADATEFGREVHAILAGGSREGASAPALDLARRFEESELGRRVGRASRVEREFDFLFALEDTVLRGQIDLWFVEAGEQIIVDYKTDDVTAEEARSRAAMYALQLQLYAIAIGRLSGRTPDRALLYFLRPDVAVPVDLEGATLEVSARTVRRFEEAQDRQEFPLQEGEHCTRCPFLRGMCPSQYPGPA